MNKETKDINKNAQKDQKVTARKTASFANEVNTEDVNYSYYSRVLNQPFDSLIELRAAEAEYYDKLKAKEDKAAQKKADAQLVEEAFKALNTTRRVYKETLLKLTEAYSVDLKKLKETFEADKKEIQDILAQAEETYSKALKAFTDKYPEGYHLTLKDGDFETTISRSNNTVDKSYTIFDIFNSMFGL